MWDLSAAVDQDREATTVRSGRLRNNIVKRIKTGDRGTEEVQSVIVHIILTVSADD